MGWVVLLSVAGVLVVGLVTTARSWHVRGGRRENMLAVALRDGCLGGAVALALLAIGWLVAWLVWPGLD